MTPSNSHESLVFKSAILSRFILLTLIITWRFLVFPYDTSASLDPNCLSDQNPNQDPSVQTVLYPRLASAIETSIVWDSVYFVRIAKCGYEYEQSYAFLPLLPICMSSLSRTVFVPLVPAIGERAVLALSGYLINNVAFVFAAFYLYRLSLIILKDPEAALRASILFCFNPASIFYSSVYSESLYSLFSIGGIYYLISGANNISVIWLALSGCARSNGVLNAGYICFETLCRAVDAAFQKKNSIMALQVICAGALRCSCIFAPFFAFQCYGYKNICLGRLPDEERPWCKAMVPLLYKYIQSHYWGVGFLRYFQVKQLPNFLLATPVLSLAMCSVVHYAKSNPQLFFLRGFLAVFEEITAGSFPPSSDDLSISDTEFSTGKLFSRVSEDNKLKQRKKVIKGDNSASHLVEYDSNTKAGYVSASVLPFVLHLGFMAATAFFVMHVQVATRFLSASPPLYWFASYLMRSCGSCWRWGYMVWAYSAAYILLGSLLCPNFYPFT